MKTILLCGKKHSGKTTAAEYIAELTGLKNLALADALKKACALVTEIPLKLFNDQEYKEKKYAVPMMLNKHVIDAVFTLFGYRTEDYAKYTSNLHTKVVGRELKNNRELLQFIGTDILREFDEDVHCKFLKKNNTFPAIISDCRFLNEINFFKDNAIVIFLDRDSELTDNHISETGIDGLKQYSDVIINNNGSIDDLKKALEKALKDNGCLC